MNWRRTIGAVVLGEAIPIALLVSVVALLGPRDPSEAALFAQSAGAWVGPIGGAVSVFALAYWAGRASTRPLTQGLLIGFIVAVIDIVLLVMGGQSFAWLFVISNLGKVLAGALGGSLAQKLGAKDDAVTV